MLEAQFARASPLLFCAVTTEVAAPPAAAVPVAEVREPPLPPVERASTLRKLELLILLSELKALPAVPFKPFCTVPLLPPRAVCVSVKLPVVLPSTTSVKLALPPLPALPVPLLETAPP